MVARRGTEQGKVVQIKKHRMTSKHTGISLSKKKEQNNEKRSCWKQYKVDKNMKEITEWALVQLFERVDCKVSISPLQSVRTRNKGKTASNGNDNKNKKL